MTYDCQDFFLFTQGQGSYDRIELHSIFKKIKQVNKKLTKSAFRTLAMCRPIRLLANKDRFPGGSPGPTASIALRKDRARAGDGDGPGLEPGRPFAFAGETGAGGGRARRLTLEDAIYSGF